VAEGPRQDWADWWEEAQRVLADLLFFLIGTVMLIGAGLAWLCGYRPKDKD
jgi:hypothetical protein